MGVILRRRPCFFAGIDRVKATSTAPGAPHGFHADYRASYRKEAAEDGWSNMQAWFKKYKVLG